MRPTKPEGWTAARAAGLILAVLLMSGFSLLGLCGATYGVFGGPNIGWLAIGFLALGAVGVVYVWFEHLWKQVTRKPPD